MRIIMSENKSKSEQNPLPELRPLESFAHLDHYFRPREDLRQWLNIPFRLHVFHKQVFNNSTMYVLWLDSWLDNRKIEGTTYDNGVGAMLDDLAKNKSFPVDVVFYQNPDDTRIYWRGVQPSDIPR